MKTNSCEFTPCTLSAALINPDCFSLLVSNLIYILSLNYLPLGMPSIFKSLHYTLITKLQPYPRMRQYIFACIRHSLSRCYCPSAGLGGKSSEMYSTKLSFLCLLFPPYSVLMHIHWTILLRRASGLGLVRVRLFFECKISSASWCSVTSAACAISDFM